MHFADEDFSPASETLLFRLYHANRSGLPLPIAEIPAHLRPNVALYCYRRGHLEDTAIRIAATINKEYRPLTIEPTSRSRPFPENISQGSLQPAAGLGGAA